MEINKILEEMHREKEQLSEAIVSLERLAAGKRKGRGRPPAWMALARVSASAPNDGVDPLAARTRISKNKNKGSSLPAQEIWGASPSSLGHHVSGAPTATCSNVPVDQYDPMENRP